jgi:alkanesulfonate monooxygenase SsuD/methylene tetrahydromethanopterin reductase-like flavin-dependent oxidoreductase (luciferase family)
VAVQAQAGFQAQRVAGAQADGWTSGSASRARARASAWLPARKSRSRLHRCSPSG